MKTLSAVYLVPAPTAMVATLVVELTGLLGSALEKARMGMRIMNLCILRCLFRIRSIFWAW